MHGCAYSRCVCTPMGRRVCAPRPPNVCGPMSEYVCRPMQSENAGDRETSRRASGIRPWHRLLPARADTRINATVRKRFEPCVHPCVAAGACAGIARLMRTRIFHDVSTVDPRRQTQHGGMENQRCPMCPRYLSGDPRAKFCSSRCRWRAYWQRCVEASARVETLPPAVLPAEAEDILPTGSDRNLVVMKLAILGRAPAGARGYRVGIKHGLSKIQRWFPVARYSGLPMFLLEPFAWPAVPVAGCYAVVYLDGRCAPIGGPRFLIAIDHTDRRILYSDGDRAYRPRRIG